MQGLDTARARTFRRGGPAIVRTAALVPAALAVAALAGCSIGNPGSPSTSPSAAPTGKLPTVPSTPHYDTLKVGSQSYVNACQAYLNDGDIDVPTAFATSFPAGSVVQETYAENSLPASWYASSNRSATSSCSIELADGPWEGAFGVIFSVDNYASRALAATAFRDFHITTQADVDKYNADHDDDTTLTDQDYSAVPGVAKTSYQKSSGSSYTLVGNKIVEFDLGTVVDDATRLEALKTAIPRAVESVRREKLTAEIGSRDYGKRIGEATYRNPCTIFTSAAFQKATGLTPDPTSVDLTINASAVSVPNEVSARGIASAECSRRALSGDPGGFARIDVEVRFFSSAAEAAQQLANDPARSDAKSTPVSGQGDGAFLYGGDFLHVVHGPYELVISGSAGPRGKPSKDAPLKTLEAVAAATATQLQ